MSCMARKAGHFNIALTIRQIEEAGTSDDITKPSSMTPQINQTGHYYPSSMI